MASMHPTAVAMRNAQTTNVCVCGYDGAQWDGDPRCAHCGGLRTVAAPTPAPARYRTAYTPRTPVAPATGRTGRTVALRAYPGWAVLCTGHSFYALHPSGGSSHAYRTFKGAAGYARRGGRA